MYLVRTKSLYMFQDDYTYTVTERFLRYVQIDTQSDPFNSNFPSTEKQKDLSHVLTSELKAMGIEDAHTDEYGYVYATIPANTKKEVPVICFCAHVDTAPDCSGTNVKPIVHKNYNGKEIVLPDDNTQIISPKQYPYLLQQKGKDVITASGKTLLGADDKAGVAIIMDMTNYLMQNSQVPHGTIKILFTPDEETGRGTEKIDIEKLGAQFGYTLDGGERGSFEDETFSADAAKIIINGVIAHPGAAKGILVNAIKIAGEVLDALPKDSFSPETTEAREGFVHPTHITGISEKAEIDFIVRDFITENLEKYEGRLKAIAEKVVAKHTGASMQFEVHEQYRNMIEVVEKYPEISENAIAAYQEAGISVLHEPIRGGTDGSRLSFMGLPCPNIFTGMQAIHSKHEWVAVQDMQKAVEVLVRLAQIWERKA